MAGTAPNLRKGWATGRPGEGRAVFPPRQLFPLLTALGTCPSLAPALIQDLVRECPFGGNSCGGKEGLPQV